MKVYILLVSINNNNNNNNPARISTPSAHAPKDNITPFAPSLR